jgi:hypothetical protein
MKAFIAVAILLWFGGSLTWARFDDAEKQKQAKIAVEQAQKAAIESQEIEAKNAEAQRWQNLNACLGDAVLAEQDFLWRNASVRHKDGSVIAPFWVFQTAAQQRANATNQCQIQHGGAR